MYGIRGAGGYGANGCLGVDAGVGASRLETKKACHMGLIVPDVTAMPLKYMLAPALISKLKAFRKGFIVPDVTAMP